MIKVIIKDIINYIKVLRFQDQWRRNNPYNFTRAGTIFPIDRILIGKMTYGILNVKTYGHKLERLSIGAYCSISDNVTFLLGGEHLYYRFSTYPVKVHICGEKYEALSKGPIIIGDDVWIGYGSTILSGVTIGQGAIIGAGSIVAKDIPPYAIYAGSRVIKYRFTNDVIERLVKVDFTSIEINEMHEVIDLIYSEMNNEFFESAFYNKHLKKII